MENNENSEQNAEQMGVLEKKTKKLNLAILPGDGIGPEIIEQALNVTKAICKKFGHELIY
jgi:3-isopropylmalate dehydrogenase